MKHIAMVLACLVCICHGSRLKPRAELDLADSQAKAMLPSLKTLAFILSSVQPSQAFRVGIASRPQSVRQLGRTHVSTAMNAAPQHYHMTRRALLMAQSALLISGAAAARADEADVAKEAGKADEVKETPPEETPPALRSVEPTPASIPTSISYADFVEEIKACSQGKCKLAKVYFKSFIQEADVDVVVPVSSDMPLNVQEFQKNANKILTRPPKRITVQRATATFVDGSQRNIIGVLPEQLQESKIDWTTPPSDILNVRYEGKYTGIPREYLMANCRDAKIRFIVDGPA